MMHIRFHGWMSQRSSFGRAVGGFLCCIVLASSALVSMADATIAPEEKCPNETSPGFRSYLPDCRAYEQASPVFKDGNTLVVEAGVADDGSRVLAHSLGGFAGSDSDTELHGSEYELSRSESGWMVSSISPPAASLSAQSLVAASPELDKTLWLARGPSESIAAENFYVREPDGTMVEIGPVLPATVTLGPPSGEAAYFKYEPQIAYMESSENLSDVLFELLGGGSLDWPGDSTVGEVSLYEYSGRGDARPELVGVDDTGHLISSCSTYLGSVEREDLYNAVSADGASVFFTAKACAGGPAVNELYARLGSFPIDTVPISEPTFSACEDCQTGVATSRHPAVAEQPAEFAGASSDGSNVFFLTSQELLAGNTGENLYDYDFANPEGHKIVRVSTGSASPAVQGVARVSEDGSHVFFVADGRLTKGAREGKDGQCLADLAPAERAEESTAEGQEEGEEPVTAGARCRPREGADNLYLFERDPAYPGGRLAFIATLTASDASDWEARDVREVQTTPDGSFLVFQSAANLTPGDTSGTPQIFEYDATSEELVRVSRGSADYESQGTENANTHGATIKPQTYAIGHVSPALATSGLAVSDDGSKVVFLSAGALTLEAQAVPAPGTTNFYEYSNTVDGGGSISDGDVYLISAGVNSQGRGLDPSGQDIFFQTATPLVPQDSDTQSDLYDARIDGGFPAPDTSAECGACGLPSLVYPMPQTPIGPISAVTQAPSLPATIKSRATSPAQIRAKNLAKALKICHAKKRMHERVRCERLAKKKYDAATASKPASRRKQ
jgi:hypothetical protein